MDSDLNGGVIVELPTLGGEFDEKFNVDYDVSPLPYLYNPDDERINAILDQVAEFCGYTFTEVPPDPDDETGGGDIMPLAAPMRIAVNYSAADGTITTELNENMVSENGEPLDSEVPDNPEYTPDPDAPDAYPYPEETDELDALRQAYKEALAKNIEEKAKLWPKIWQAIRYISHIACWTDDDTDTFITQVRHQMASFESENACAINCAPCEDGTIAIPLAYAPNPKNFFLGGLMTVVRDGRVKHKHITYDYLEKHYDRASNTVYINRYDFPKPLLNFGRGCCACKLKVNIRIDYLAGYDRIPDGLLPLMCQFISKLEEAKIGMSNCHHAMTQVAGLLKRKKSGNVEYEWSTADANSEKTQTLYTDLYNIGMLDEVMAISRCEIALLDNLVIGDVV